MRIFILILLLLTAFSGVLLWRILRRPEASAPEDPPSTSELLGPPDRAPPAFGKTSGPILNTLIDIQDSRGTSHALLTGFSRQGLYYRRGEEEAGILDIGIQVGGSLDLAVDGEGRAYAAYWDARTGEVRFAVPGRKPKAWIGLRRLERPNNLTLSTNPEGVLISYYDEETEILYYSYWNRRKESWSHGVANRGGGYRVVTGKTGNLVLKN